MNYENNALRILSFASTRSTWVSVASCANSCHMDYQVVHSFLRWDEFGQIASRYHYEYAIRQRRGKDHGLYISVVSLGYA